MNFKSRTTLFWGAFLFIGSVSFKFKSKAEGVLLYDPEEQQVDVYRWTDAASDVSFARVPDGTGEFVLCANPTCGSTNGTSCGN